MLWKEEREKLEKQCNISNIFILLCPFHELLRATLFSSTELYMKTLLLIAYFLFSKIAPTGDWKRTTYLVLLKRLPVWQAVAAFFRKYIIPTVLKIKVLKKLEHRTTNSTYWATTRYMQCKQDELVLLLKVLACLRRETQIKNYVVRPLRVLETHLGRDCHYYRKRVEKDTLTSLVLN